MATMKNYESEMENEMTDKSMLHTLAEKIEDIEDMIENAMENENGGYSMGMTTTAQVVPTISDYGYGYGGRGVGYGTVPDGFIGYQTSRDVIENRHDNAKLHCETDKNVNAGFAFQNLNSADRFAGLRELTVAESQATRANDDGNTRFIEASVLANGRLSQEISSKIFDNMRDAELRAERRADRVDDKICNIDKDIAVQGALAAERDKHVNFKLDALLTRNAQDDAFARQLAKFQAVNGCQPALSSCGL